MAKQFHISDVLSVSTGRLVSTRHMSGVYDVINHLVGESVSTLGLLDAAEPAKQALLKQHPQLANVEFKDFDPAQLNEWVKKQERIFGTTLAIEAMSNTPSIRDDFAVARSVGKPVVTIGPSSRTDIDTRSKTWSTKLTSAISRLTKG